MFKTITISKGVTVNIGDFQNQKLEVSVSYEVEPGETAEAATQKVADQCRTLLLRELEPVLNELPGWRARQWRDLLGVPEPELVPGVYVPADDELDEDDWDDEDEDEEDLTPYPEELEPDDELADDTF